MTEDACPICGSNKEISNWMCETCYQFWKKQPTYEGETGQDFIQSQLFSTCMNYKADCHPKRCYFYDKCTEYVKRDDYIKEKDDRWDESGRWADIWRQK